MSAPDEPSKQVISVCVSRRAQVDERLLRVYLMLGAGDDDLAAMFGVSTGTLRRHFGLVLIRVRAERRTSIRKLIWEKAKGGNVALLLWLARHELESDDVAALPPPRRTRKRFDYQRFAEEFRIIHGLSPDTGERPAETDDPG